MFLSYLSRHDLCQLVDGLLLEDALRVEQLLQLGHGLGLGDRHGENLLLDASSGDVVHVDFAMLFDKGLQLTKPEMVPFRLTQNMIDGCGLSGYEGVFRKTCEIVLQVSRENKETLMSVLDTFVNDPLVEWTSGARGGVNSLAHDALKRIESRLSGVVVGVGAAPSTTMARAAVRRAPGNSMPFPKAPRP